MKAKEEYVCPKCKHKNRIKLTEEVTQENVEKIISREIFHFNCKKCGEPVNVEFPLKVIGDDYLIYYTPGDNRDISDHSKNILRVCDTYDDLKEKIFVLEDDLNDIVIEFIKNYIKNNLSEDVMKDVTRIRYNSKEEDTLYFSLIGVDKFAECTMEQYENIKKLLKIKKINKCVLIDEYTYQNFYKMRML
ncbi:MAG: hypothetical protein J1F35_07265 [Erysipelotrichales bacterium]|nr:hypothetical protein [Erysipelotrichales bacterium]